MSAEPKFTSLHVDVDHGPTAQIFEPVFENKPETTDPPKPSRQMVDNKTKLLRSGVILIGIVILIVGRTSVPDNDVPCIVDRLMNVFDSLNSYVVSSPFLRNFMLIVCSLFMDLTFLSTTIYWMLYGTTSRVIVSLVLFYGTRALVQLMWYSPIPAGYYWDYPGFPSLVVGYGRTTDFFFSGHIGFVVINACEWFKNGKPWLTAVLGMGGLYTAFVMLVFQGHYSIDIFTGIVVAALIFMIVDKYKESIDHFFHYLYVKVGGLFKKKQTSDKKDLNESFLDQERQA